MSAYVREDTETRDLLEKRIHEARCEIVRQHAIKRLYDHAWTKGLMTGLGLWLLYAFITNWK